MSKKGVKRMSPATNIIPFATKKPFFATKKSRFTSMTKQDWKEANEVTKRERGLSRLSPNDIYEEDKE